MDLVVGHHEGEDERDGDVGDEADDERRHDGARDRVTCVLRLLTRRRDDVKADERVETRRRAREHLTTAHAWEGPETRGRAKGKVKKNQKKRKS